MSEHRVGLGYDVHPFVASSAGERRVGEAPTGETAAGERRLILAGVVVDGAPGLVGHSDADAVAHAVADALLAAAGLGDIGTMFPASDERHRGADSMGVLAEVVAIVESRGWRVGNVSVVVNAERPRLAPYLPAMTDRLAAALHTAAVNITPKRGEGLGPVGRGEGIAVWATALVERPEPRPEPRPEAPGRDAVNDEAR